MIAEVVGKRCPRCSGEKPLNQFGNDKSRRDGLACWCKECLSANGRKWHAANRDRAIERHRAWYAKNPPNREKAVERTRLWCEANPDRLRTIRKNAKHRRRAKMRGNMTAPDFREWEASQRKVCHWCGINCDSYEIDHRVPLAKGGKHERRNLVISCRPCNRKKGARCPVEFAQSLGKLV